MAKPSVKEVKQWHTVYDSDEVLVKKGTVHFDDDYWMVLDRNTNKKRYLYGESAWSDAARLAADLDFSSIATSF
jgi:hypothetical protein